jgi:crossover junction endodeoxyribonuclease RuvC
MNNNYTRVIGIDPGLETTGVGILDIKGNRYIPVLCKCIITKSNLSSPIRFKLIYDELDLIIKDFSPDCLAIEDIFFSANVKTALAVGAARGVCILAGCNNNLSIYEYTPLQVKQAVVGYGRATKKQMKYMLQMILGVKDDFFTVRDDGWDAVGVAMCHASMSQFNNKVSQQLKK